MNFEALQAFHLVILTVVNSSVVIYDLSLDNRCRFSSFYYLPAMFNCYIGEGGDDCPFRCLHNRLYKQDKCSRFITSVQKLSIQSLSSVCLKGYIVLNMS